MNNSKGKCKEHDDNNKQYLISPLVSHLSSRTMNNSEIEDILDKAMSACKREAQRNSWKVSICISDNSGTPLRVYRNPKAFPASYQICVEKAKTAVMFQKETGILEDGSKKRVALLSAPFVLMRGGVPFDFGSIGVSGVAPEQDEQIARVGVEYINMNIMGDGKNQQRSKL